MNSFDEQSKTDIVMFTICVISKRDIWCSDYEMLEQWERYKLRHHAEQKKSRTRCGEL